VKPPGNPSQLIGDCSGLHAFDHVTGAKVESQIRSTYDFEMFILAEVFSVAPEELSPVPSKTKDVTQRFDYR